MTRLLKAALIAPAAAAIAFGAFAQDVTRVAPETSRVLFENSHIRVVRSHFRPGAQEAPHTHPAGYYIVTRGGTLRVTFANGTVTNWSPHTGDTEWSDGEPTHTARNMSHGDMEYILVEVKSAAQGAHGN
jgi:quercetin dioxygenase-like cupin family protein